MELPNFTETKTISTGYKSGAIKVNQFEIKYNTVDENKILVETYQNYFDENNEYKSVRIGSILTEAVK